MNLVYINSANGLSKAALETVTYAKKLGSDVAVVTNGNASAELLATLGAYGASTILQDANIDGQDTSQLVKLVGAAAAKVGATNIIFSHDLIGKAVAPRLSVRLKAGLVAGAVALPQADGTTKVNVFSGKAFGYVKVNSAVRIISLLPNSIQPEQTGGNCSTEAFDSQAGSSAITVKATKKPEGAIPLPEAELVVSAGRGLKGPENWGMVEDLAAALGAATACSRPVSDIGWRPHHEHVGIPPQHDCVPSFNPRQQPQQREIQEAQHDQDTVHDAVRGGEIFLSRRRQPTSKTASSSRVSCGDGGAKGALRRRR
jgi:electron transfer flavoprotein alpha subunit